MLRGKIVEIGPTEAIFTDPRHAYTRSLLSSIPVPNPRIERARRPIAFDYEREKPVAGAWLLEVSPGHLVLSTEPLGGSDNEGSGHSYPRFP